MRFIITGAASGIGRAIALELASRPIFDRAQAFVLVDRDGERLSAVVSEVVASGSAAEGIVENLGDPAAAKRIVARCLASFGGVDCVISNAGLMQRKALLDTSSADFDQAMAVNARAMLFLAQAAFPYLRDASGSIVATLSTAAANPVSYGGAYSASKASLWSLVQQMAAEWGPEGIRVNAVSPGPTHTHMTSNIFDDVEARQRRGAEIPLGRVGKPEDIAKAVRFLASPDAAFITGVNLIVDGGLNVTLGNSRNSAVRDSAT